MHTRTHAHTHTRTHMHRCTHARTHACMHARMHAHTHAHMHIYTHACTHACTHTHNNIISSSTCISKKEINKYWRFQNVVLHSHKGPNQPYNIFIKRKLTINIYVLLAHWPIYTMYNQLYSYVIVNN